MIITYKKKDVEMMKLKHVPNILGFSRILMCAAIILIVLIIEKPLGMIFLTVYLLAGITDMIDGPLARRIKDAKSDFGAVLDSIADMLLVIVGVFFVVPIMMKERPEIYSWIFISFIIALSFKIGSGLIGYIKHKEFVLLHTYSNKVLAFLLFIIPIIYFARPPIVVLNFYFIFALVCVYIITTEEILINLMLKKPSRNIKSIFGVREANRNFEA